MTKIVKNTPRCFIARKYERSLPWDEQGEWEIRGVFIVNRLDTAILCAAAYGLDTVENLNSPKWNFMRIERSEEIVGTIKCFIV